MRWSRCFFENTVLVDRGSFGGIAAVVDMLAAEILAAGGVISLLGRLPVVINQPVVILRIIVPRIILRKGHILYVCHDCISYKKGKLKGYFLYLCQDWWLNCAHEIWFVSEFTRKEVEKFHGAVRGKTQLIQMRPRAIDVKRKRLLWIGRDEPHKDLQFLLAVGHYINFNVDVFVVGVKKESISIGCVRFLFLGKIPEQLLDLLLISADILLVTSKEEGFHLPTDEALSVGTLVLARDIPIFRERNGPLYRGLTLARDPEEMGLLINSWLNNE